MQLLCARGQNRVITSLFSDASATLPSPVSGLSIPFSVGVVDRVPGTISASSQYYTPEPMGLWDIFIGIGNPSVAPIAGTFTLTFGTGGTSTTGGIAYNASASAISTALNALTTITSAGGVTVAFVDGLFTVTFDSAGARTQITGDASNLAPVSIVETGTEVDGTSSLNEIQTIKIYQSPATFVELTTVSAGPGATVTAVQTGGGGLNAKYRVNLSPSLPVPPDYAVYGGIFSVTVRGDESAPVAWNAAATDLQTAIGALASVGGAANVFVSYESPGQYLIVFQGAKANTDMGAVTSDGTALLCIQYLTGTLHLDVVGIDLLLAGSQKNVSTTFQIVGSYNGEPREQLYGPVSINVSPGIITPGALTPQPVVSFYTSAQVDALFLSSGSDGTKNKRGLVAISNGATGAQAVTFGTAFATTPSWGSITLAIPSGGDLFDIKIDWSTVATTGFSFVIPDGVTVPASGYKAAWYFLE